MSVAEETGLSLALSQPPEDRFCHIEAQMMFSIDKLLHFHLFPQTDNFLAFDVYLIYILSQKRTIEQMNVSYPLIANKAVTVSLIFF